MPSFKHFKFLDPNVRSAVVELFSAEVLMGDSDVNPDCTLVDDIAMISLS